MPRTEPAKNTDIEVLRAVAILFTLFSHLLWGLLPTFGRMGRMLQSSLQFWTGVDLFFGISGFIITASLLRQLAAGDPPPSLAPSRRWREFLAFAVPFWIRRVFRLLPSAWLWILVTLLLAAGFNTHQSFGALRDNLDEAAAALLNVANLHFYEWFTHGNSAYGSLGVYWSLSLEEQFYLIFPFLLYFVPRRLLVPVLLAAFFAQVFAFRPDGFVPGNTSLLWFVRTDALLLGVLIALWKNQAGSYRKLAPRFLRRPRYSLPVVGGGIVLLALIPSSAAVAAFSTGLTALCCGFLVWLASYDRDLILAPCRLKAALVWLGTRSYSVYLIHTICHAFVQELKKNAGIAEGHLLSESLTILSVALILTLAECNYRLVEKPLRHVGRRLADRILQRLRRPAVVAAAPVPG